MATVLITGGTGLIGTEIIRELLAQGHAVNILTRSPENYVSNSKVQYSKWNIARQTIDPDAIANADYIIHLAGAGVGEHRWTAKRKREILESRTKSSELLVTAIRENKNRVKAVIAASAIGWYGPGNGRPHSFVETDPPHGDFLGTTCREWEASIDPVGLLGKRLVKLRTGIVLSNEGGALPKFKRPLRAGVATILSNGRQVMSWIHIADLARLYIMAMENEGMQGVYNAVAPHPVTNRDFVLKLAKTMRGKYFVPVYVPAIVLKIVLGEMSVEVLKSASVSGEKIKTQGFLFLYPSIASAIRNLTV